MARILQQVAGALPVRAPRRREVGPWPTLSAETVCRHCLQTLSTTSYDAVRLNDRGFSMRWMTWRELAARLSLTVQAAQRVGRVWVRGRVARPPGVAPAALGGHLRAVLGSRARRRRAGSGPVTPDCLLIVCL